MNVASISEKIIMNSCFDFKITWVEVTSKTFLFYFFLISRYICCFLLTETLKLCHSSFQAVETLHYHDIIMVLSPQSSLNAHILAIDSPAMRKDLEQNICHTHVSKHGFQIRQVSNGLCSEKPFLELSFLFSVTKERERERDICMEINQTL